MDLEEFKREIPIPQLAKFKLLKMSAEHFEDVASGKLQSRVAEECELHLEERVPNNLYEEQKISLPNCRIVGRVILDGSWRNADTKNIVAKFYGSYESRFVFQKDVDIALLRSLMDTKLYRDYLFSQIFPLAQTHMLDQLRLMGVNSNRKIGYDSATKRETTVTIPKNESKLKNKKSPVKLGNVAKK